MDKILSERGVKLYKKQYRRDGRHRICNPNQQQIKQTMSQIGQTASPVS